MNVLHYYLHNVRIARANMPSACGRASFSRCWSWFFFKSRCQTHKGLGGKFRAFFQRQIFQGHFSPGSLTMTASRTILAEHLFGEFTGVFAVSVAAENHHQFVTVLAGHEHPVKALHMIKKISYDHNNIRSAHLA